ncbi:MAG: GGDEF domain-containing protein [Candidatus Omnitrophota bacterium]|nr:GGDEF domain-containing protein [Candidatus Omnitrophota bacterium]
MIAVMLFWVLAMISGLCWARPWTASFTGLTLAVFLWTQAGTLSGWSGWLQLAVFGVTPWLLAAEQRRDEQRLKRLHAQEAQAMTRLSEEARTLLSLQASTQQLEAQIAHITDVYHVTKDTGRALRLPELFSASLDTAPRLLRASGLRLIDLSEAQPQVLRASRTSDGRMVPSPNGAGANHILEMEQAIISRTVTSGAPTCASQQEFACALPEGVTRVAWSPLWREQKPIGVLVADELPEEQLKTLSIVANQLSLQLSRIHLYQAVESLAVTDSLTGLSVRGYFMDRAREELSRSKRHTLFCTLLMTDLDRFKEKNDTFGHLVGDVVLKDVAQLLKRNLREVDLIARYGGEEFILLLIETDIEQAMPIAQRLKQLVELHPIRAYDELLTQTISIGLAAYPNDAHTLEALIERADQALYAAKHAGRNRVFRWDERTTSV